MNIQKFFYHNSRIPCLDGMQGKYKQNEYE